MNLEPNWSFIWQCAWLEVEHSSYGNADNCEWPQNILFVLL